jgi:hypothetical protein
VMKMASMTAARVNGGLSASAYLSLIHRTPGGPLRAAVGGQVWTM